MLRRFLCYNSFAVMHVCSEISDSLQLPCDGSCSVRTGYVFFGTLVFAIHVFSSLSEKWSSPDINGQPPPPCYSFTFTPVGERRAAMFGGDKGLGNPTVSDLFIVDLSRHTVVSGECYKPGSHAILTQGPVT